MRKVAVFLITMMAFSFACAQTVQERFAKVDAFFERGEYEEAVAECKEIVRVAPTNSLGYEYLATAYTRLGEYERAISAGKQAVRLNPAYYFTYTILGYAYFSTRRYDLAAESFEKSLQLDPDDSYATYYLGRSLYGKGENTKSREVFERLIKRFPQSEYVADAELGMAHTYLREERFSLAIEMYNNIITNYPSYKYKDGALYWMAEAYFRNKQFDAGIRASQELLEGYPESEYRGRAQFLLGALYVEREEYDKAIEELKEFIRQYPQSESRENAHLLLAQAYSKKGMVEESLAELKKTGWVHWGILILLVALCAIPVFFGGVIWAMVWWIKKKRGVPPGEVSSPIFKVRDVVFIFLLTLILPFILTLVVGKLIYGQYLIVLTTSIQSVEGVYVFSISKLIGDIILASLVLWILLKKYFFSKEDVGFVSRGWKSVIITPGAAILLLTVIEVVYVFVVEDLLGINLPKHYLAPIIHSIKTVSQGVLLFAVVVIVGPVVEEIIFRGFFYKAFRRYVSVRWGIVFSALLFAVIHFDLRYLVLYFFMGVALAYVYERTRSLIPCMLTHMLNNFLFFTLAYFFPQLYS